MAFDVSKLTTAQKKLALELLKKKEKLKKRLPHRYGSKFYAWQRRWWDSRAKMGFITASNQSGKSHINIRTCIEWAGNTKLWDRLWPGKTPNLFWYFYPDSGVVTTEFDTKWKPLLPTQEACDDPDDTFGWEIIKSKNGEFRGIKFHSGVIIEFRYYSQSISKQQASTLYAIFTDEELPESHYSELQVRLTTTGGYFRMVFTATLGQELWRQTMEPLDGEEERFPDALKIQVAMHDCLKFEDGTPGHITQEIIDEVIKNCANEAEIQRRVYGRFVKSTGRLVPNFQSKRHMAADHPLPSAWSVYGCVDSGSGKTEKNKTRHSAGILFLAVNPERTRGRFFRAWRGDGKETTNGDIFDKYKELRGTLKPLMQIYDPSGVDFGIIAKRAGESFQIAIKGKSYTEGWPMLDTLFQFGVVDLARNSELMKLSVELSNLTKASKQKGTDNLADPAKYLVRAVPWNWPEILKGKKTITAKDLEEFKAVQKASLSASYELSRPGFMATKREMDEERRKIYNPEDEINEYNDFLETY